MPIHTPILVNIHALLDYNHVPKTSSKRIAYFSQTFGLTAKESQAVLSGEMVPNKKLLKDIADKFEVDQHWLLENRI